jgi:hypothetical protein
MDLPWNPAVLEQRIGRVHRLGQRQPVQVVNFVAQGTIEEGMLSVLQFKKTLFAGVLDGGEKEVFLGGSRLNRFMETVERASASIPAATVEEAREDAPPAGEPEEDRTPEPAAAAPTPAADPLAGLLQSGLALLQQLAGAAQPSTGAAGRPGLSLVTRDQRTGETYLKLPMPKPEVLDQALQAFGALLESFRGK